MTNTSTDKHVVITGAGQGIGEAIASSFKAAGYSLTLMGRTKSKLDAVAQRLQLPERSVVTVDVCDPDKVSSAFAAAREHLGAISVLVNNAGQAESAPIERTDLSLWQRMLDVNLTGVYLCCHQVINEMKAQDWGRIVNVASTAGLKGYAYTAAYTAAKHGVVGLTRALSQELARTGITVNAVCPGFTKTAIFDTAIENIVKTTSMNEEQAVQALVSVNPQKKWVEPEEVANAVLWLCNADSASMNGQSIVVAGGEIT